MNVWCVGILRCRLQRLRSLLLALVSMILLFQGCEDEFPPAPPVDQAGRLENIVWRLESIEDHSSGMVDPVDSVPAVTISFTDDLRFKGSTGRSCNIYGGDYESSDSTMKFSSIWRTRIWCLEVNPVETRYMNLLDSVTGYKVTPTGLQLYVDKVKTLNYVKVAELAKPPRILYNQVDTSRPIQYTVMSSSFDFIKRWVIDTTGIVVAPPRGGKLAYTIWRTNRRSIIVANIDGTNRKEIYTGLEAAAVETVTLSPNGSKVAFGVDELYAAKQGLIVIDVASGATVKLTTEMAQGAAPAFSPDGTEIAFYSHDGAVHVADMAGGSAPRVVAVGAAAARGFLFGADRLEWSPDGSRIAFSGRSPYGGDFDIYTVKKDGSGLTNLTNDATVDGGPTWSPDGKWIAFISGNRLGRIATDGSGIVELLTPSGSAIEELYPQWSPDGKYILYIAITRAVQPAGPIPGVLRIWDAEARDVVSVADQVYKPFWIP